MFIYSSIIALIIVGCIFVAGSISASDVSWKGRLTTLLMGVLLLGGAAKLIEMVCLRLFIR